MPAIYIDADACPVRAEVYRVAKRHGLMTWVVANQWMDMPNDPMIRLEVVDHGFDAADNWIAERVGAGDVVVSDDIPLAARCITAGAKVITNRGDERDENNIGEALSMRELLQYARESGDGGRGQKPIDERDRRWFLQRLEVVVQAALGSE
ncbi:MAG: YaiI/YqxD family protein [Planctomycetota bacterium]|jgi:uncharacterized protein YaiI (UPF0178 family)|nr:YaiI/YqxD family protein [Planctomycetota bacterium]